MYVQGFPKCLAPGRFPQNTHALVLPFFTLMFSRTWPPSGVSVQIPFQCLSSSPAGPLLSPPLDSGGTSALFTSPLGVSSSEKLSKTAPSKSSTLLSFSTATSCFLPLTTLRIMYTFTFISFISQLCIFLPWRWWSYIYIYMCICIYAERGRRRLFYGTGLWLWGWANMKCAGQSGRVEAGTGFSAAVLRWNSFFGKLQSLFLRPLTEWMRPTHIMEGNPLYLKSTDGKC